MKIILDAQAAKKLLLALEKNQKTVDVSLDLGQTITNVNLNDDIWDLDSIRKISEDLNSVYFIDDGEYFQAAISDTHYYRLFRSISSRVPALMIDGILMHRVKDVDPKRDARMKAKLCARKDSKMLEICTGLGYSAIACLEMGIQSIVTIEKDENVLKLADINPWSSRLFTDGRVRIINADAVKEIQQLSDNLFDGILHDPPRFSMGTELYSLEFYQEIYRVLKSKGILYHYVGTPGSRYKKRDIPKGVMTRLRDARFRDVKRREDTLGVTARK